MTPRMTEHEKKRATRSNARDWVGFAALALGILLASIPTGSGTAWAADPSTTDTTKLCANGLSNAHIVDEITTSAVAWTGVCQSDPTLDGATLQSDGTDSALDSFGSVWFEDTPNPYVVTADSYSIARVGDRTTLTLHDDDISLTYYGVVIDVTISRVFEGSDTRWDVEVRDSATGEIADVPFVFTGTLDNENRATWTTSRAVRSAWTSDGGSKKVSDAKEAILAHHTVADSFRKYTGMNNFQLEVEGGTLSYFLSVLEYSGCSTGAARTAALGIAEHLPSTFGDTRNPLTGTPCTVTWPIPDIDPMTFGEPFDQTFPAASSALSWTGGGAMMVDGLPAGLEAEFLDEIVAGVAPSVRIHGIPEAAGPFRIRLTAMDAMYRSDWIELTGAIVAPADDTTPDPDAPPQKHPSSGPTLDRLAETGQSSELGLLWGACVLAGSGALLSFRAATRWRSARNQEG